MKKRRFFLLFLWFLWPIIAGAGPAGAEPSFRVYAAASLTGPLKEIITAFEQESGVQVKVNFASSGNLARQIELGASADVFISASQKWMDYAQEKETIDPETRINPIGNAIVLISPQGIEAVPVRFDKDFSLADAFNGKFSIGDPDHVPAGKYAQEAMQALGWWDRLSPRLIRAKDVRQALLIVESGEVEMGTVFASDAAKSAKVKVVGVFPEVLHAPVVYSAALCTQRTETAFSEKFLNFLLSEKAQKIFLDYGFVQVP